MRIEDDFFLSLPADPEEAFPRFIEWAMEKYNVVPYGRRDEGDARQFLTRVFGFIDGYEMDVDLSKKLPWPSDEFWAYFDTTMETLLQLSTKFEIARLRRLQAGAKPVFRLNEPARKKVRHYVDQIRELVASMNLTVQKRDELAKLLGAFATALERDRTDVEALTSLYLFLKREAKEELKPILDKVEKIFDTIATFGEWIGLPKSDEKKQLPSPPKKIEDKRDVDESDDDIPF